MSTTSVKTISHIIEPENSLISNTPIEIVATIPTDLSSVKIPISITISYLKDKRNGGSNNELTKLPTRLTYYHYAIPKRTNSGKNGEEVVGIPLIDSNNDWVRDVSRKLATSIAKKYKKPVYVAWSATSMESSSTISMDQIYVLKNCIDFMSSILVK